MAIGTTETRAEPARPPLVVARPARPPSRRRSRSSGLRSARTRVLLAYVLLLAVSLVAAGVAVRAVLVNAVETRVESSLEQEVEELERLVGGTDPRTGRAFGADVRAIFDTYFRRNVTYADEGLYAFVDGEPYLVSAEPPAELTSDRAFVERIGDLTSPERGRLQTEAGAAEYLAVPLRVVDPATDAPQVMGVFVVAAFPQADLDRVDATMTRIGLALLGLLAAASALAYAVTGRLLAPLRKVIETARSIHENDLTARMQPAGTEELAELSETFNAMLDRVERALATQRDFVSDAGHELRTPITIVRGHLELMTDDPVDREETITLVLDELDRMSRLVNDLLLLSRSEGPDFLDRRPVRVEELLPEVFSKVSALADRAWRYDGAVPGELDADPQRLTQALTQLVANAVQHTGPGDVIALGSSRDGDRVHVWVRDEGEGIAPVDRVRIFERFARVEGQARRSDGHGLGLAIVTAVVEGHGGRIELDSEVGRGSTFRLVLPVSTPDRPRQGAAT